MTSNSFGAFNRSKNVVVKGTKYMKDSKFRHRQIMATWIALIHIDMNFDMTRAMFRKGQYDAYLNGKRRFGKVS